MRETDLTATFHPIASMFPLLDGEEYEALRRDIAEHGQREPITIHENLILDGRNRYRACIAAGLTPETRPLPFGKDPVQFVLSENMHRRHLSVEQRAIIAARLPRIGKGSNQHGRVDTSRGVSSGMSRDERARLAAVSPKTVERAEKLVDGGIDELVDQVERRILSVNEGARAASLPREKQKIIADSGASRASTVLKQEARAVREEELAERTEAATKTLAGAGTYSVIMADPPWRFEVWSPTGMDRAADNHYPTMTIEKLMDLRVPSAPDCCLFLWATAPMLPQAIDVMAAWGFSYRTHFIWEKDRIITGYWNRGKHELLLIGTRGEVPAPAPGTQWDSVIPAHHPGRHSAKPDRFYELVEAYFPTARRLEMFARENASVRAGWDYWGNEAPIALGASE